MNETNGENLAEDSKTPLRSNGPAVWSLCLAIVCFAFECAGIVESVRLAPQMMLVPTLWSVGGIVGMGLLMASLVLGLWGWRRSVSGGGARYASLGLGLCVINLLGGFLWLVVGAVEAGVQMSWSYGCCREVQIALRAYASDHDGKYPDADMVHPSNSNEVFRKLFVEGYLEAKNERIFGAAFSLHRPDGIIGQAPDYREALKAGENHWAMTKGLTDHSSGEMPLIFENPVVATWPPKWNADAVLAPKLGRVWLGWRVVVGFNDGSVNWLRLEARQGSLVGLAPKPDGSPVFPDVHPTPEILDIEK